MKPHDELTVAISVHLLSDGLTVHHKGGAKPYILRRGLTLYQDTKGEAPIHIEGTFLISQEGTIKQIAADKIMMVTMTLIEFRDWIDDQLDQHEHQ